MVQLRQVYLDYMRLLGRKFRLIRRKYKKEIEIDSEKYGAIYRFWINWRIIKLILILGSFDRNSTEDPRKWRIYKAMKNRGVARGREKLLQEQKLVKKRGVQEKIGLLNIL